MAGGLNWELCAVCTIRIGGGELELELELELKLVVVAA